MKRILILIIGLIGVAYGQSSPTSSKTRFVNGLYLGTKLDAYFAAADSNAIYWRADSALMAKYKGTARALAFSSDLAPYKLIADTFFTNGYTTRARTKQQIDSLGAAEYQNRTSQLQPAFPLRLSSRINADTTAIRGILLGDSNFDLPERTFTPFLKNVLRYQYSRGVGYVTFGNDSPTAGQNNNTYSGTWVQTAITGGGVGLDGREIFSNTATSSITVSTNNNISDEQGSFNSMVVYYKKGAAGTVGYKINGGAQTDVILSTGSGLGEFTVTCPTVGLNSVEFILVSGEVTFLGALVENTSRFGITLSKAAQSGARSSNFASLTSQGIWQDMVFDINPDFVLVMLGTNDWGNGVLPSDYKTNMQTIESNIKLALPNAAIYFIAPPQAPIYQAAAIAPMKTYRDSLFNMCSSDSTGFLSLYDIYNRYTAAKINYYFNDSIHYNKEGAQVNANYLIGQVFPTYTIPLPRQDSVFAKRVIANQLVTDNQDGTGIVYFDDALQSYIRRVGTTFSIVGATVVDLEGANLVDAAAITSTSLATGAITGSTLGLTTSAGIVGTVNSTNASGGYQTWSTSGTIIADIGTQTQIFGSGGIENFGINARGSRSLAFGTNNTPRLSIASGGAVSATISVAAPKFIGNSSTPSITGGSATYIGTGASTSISGNDVAGVITLVTGTGCGSTGASNRSALTVDFSVTYASAPTVIIQAIQQGGLSSTDGPSNNFFLRRDAVGTTSFTVYLPVGVTLTDSTTYLITYQVIGR